MIRHLFGFSGEALTAGAVGSDAKRSTPADIAAYLTNAATELDIDGDDEAKALTDGLLLIRYLFGFTGNALAAGAVGEAAERATASAIQAYIAQRLPDSNGSGGGSGDGGGLGSTPAMLAVQVRMALIRALIPAAALPLAAVLMGARATAVLIRAAIAATPAAPMVVQPAQKPLR